MVETVSESHPVKNLLLFILTVIVVGYCCMADAQVTNIVIPPTSGPSTNRQSIVVSSKQTARILHLNLTSSQCWMNLKFKGQVLRYNAAAVAGATAAGAGTVGLPIIQGPAEVELELVLTSPGGTTTPSLCVVQLANNEEQFTPSNSVVVPADSGGPVEIILESSIDLITWTATVPGTYATSTQKRFFRVRAVRR